MPKSLSENIRERDDRQRILDERMRSALSPARSVVITDLGSIGEDRVGLQRTLSMLFKDIAAIFASLFPELVSAAAVAPMLVVKAVPGKRGIGAHYVAWGDLAGHVIVELPEGYHAQPSDLFPFVGVLAHEYAHACFASLVLELNGARSFDDTNHYRSIGHALDEGFAQLLEWLFASALYRNLDKLGLDRERIAALHGELRSYGLVRKTMLRSQDRDTRRYLKTGNFPHMLLYRLYARAIRKKNLTTEVLKEGAYPDGLLRILQPLYRDGGLQALRDFISRADMFRANFTPRDGPEWQAMLRKRNIHERVDAILFPEFRHAGDDE